MPADLRRAGSSALSGFLIFRKKHVGYRIYRGITAPRWKRVRVSSNVLCLACFFFLPRKGRGGKTVLKQRFEKAVLASRGDEDALMLLKFAADGITDYVNSVCKHYYMAKILVAEKGRFESREEISSLDKSRHLAHENVIMLLRAVNRQCEKQRIEPFCDVDLNDRHAVADFCGAFANEVFNHMIEGGIDEAVLAHEEGYDPESISLIE